MERRAAPGFRPKQIILTIKRRVIVTATLFAVLFSTLAAVQYLFVRYQLFSAAWAEAADAADQIRESITDTNGLDLEAVRNAFFPVREWYIIGTNGTVLDLEGTQPGIVGPVVLPTERALDSAQAFVSGYDEAWRIFARKLQGGTVVVGVTDPSSLSDPNGTLITNAARFGTNLTDAIRLNAKKIDSAVDYAVMDEGGYVRKAGGGVPLRAVSDSLSKLLAAREAFLEGKRYLFASRAVYDQGKRQVATVVVPRDVTAEEKSLRIHWRFNAVVAMLAWFIVVAIGLAYFVSDEIHRQRVHPTLTEAREQGEGQFVEFKRSLLWDPERGYEDEKLRLKVIRSVVGFLNSGGGALFIGVQNDGRPWGIADDLKRCDGSEDKFHQRLRSLFANSIGGEFSQYIMSQISDDPDFAGYRVCCIGVEGAHQAAFLKSGAHSYFYVRSGPETQELDMQKAYRYIKKAGLQI